MSFDKTTRFSLDANVLLPPLSPPRPARDAVHAGSSVASWSRSTGYWTDGNDATNGGSRRTTNIRQDDDDLIWLVDNSTRRLCILLGT